MNQTVEIHAAPAMVEDALATLLEVGLVPVRIDAHGTVRWPEGRRAADALRIELLKRSPMLARRLAESARRWTSHPQPEIATLVEGCVAVPLQVASGGWIAAIACTEALLRGEAMDQICATAGADRRAMESLMRRAGLVAEGDLDRQVRMLRRLWSFVERAREATGLVGTPDSTATTSPLNAADPGEAPIVALVSGIDRRDPTNRGHSRRVSLLCRMLAEALGLPATQVRRAELAGLVHDVGKVALPSRILRKPGPLTRQEYAQVRRHPQIGCRLLRGWLGMRSVLGAVRHHHERWDGLGYPKGLRGDRIPRLARIVAIADAYDAMVSDRPYRAALSHEQAFAELRRGRGTHFDPEMVPVFLGLDFRAFEALRREEHAAVTGASTRGMNSDEPSHRAA